MPEDGPEDDKADNEVIMGYNIHHTRAQLLFRHKHGYEDGEIVELKAWVVPRSEAKPEGLKYSLVYIGANGRRILGY